MKNFYFLMIALMILTGCLKNTKTKSEDNALFPDELVNFTPLIKNPVFTGTGTNTWDKKIRERGYILKEDSIYKMWYTGYGGGGNEQKKLGYATSVDGINWTRYSGNPIFDDYWTEDVQVVKYQGKYIMVAEGENDIAHLLTSPDGIKWERRGNIDIRKVNGSPIDKGAYGTPTLWKEKNKWYLFYEREDRGIWLATSADMKVWTNVQDEPVINMGPETYDAYGVAMDQIIKYKGRYYGYYHATPDKDWSEWNSNVAVSNDLVHWKKYDKNPIVKPDSVSNNYSSPIVVFDGTHFLLYTMHNKVRVYTSRNDSFEY